MPAIAAVKLADGRTRLWLIEGIFVKTRAQKTADPDSDWSDWGEFGLNPPNATPAAIAATSLKDGRIELYLVDTAGHAWRSTQVAADDDTTWVEWQQFS